MTQPTQNQFESFTMVELKAMAYDYMANIEEFRRRSQLINQEIVNRQMAEAQQAQHADPNSPELAVLAKKARKPVPENRE